jgi:hypothetical protein
MLNKAQIDGLKQMICGVVLHWTAGSYKNTYDSYHFCITWDGKKAHAIQTRSLREKGAHTWRRNTGRIGISLCGGIKEYPIRNEQVQAMAKLIAELCILLDIELKGSHVAMDLYDNSKFHDVPNVTDHVFYSKMDKYGKIDIGELLPVVLNKAGWYLGKLKSGEHKFEYTKDLT